jgi:hypoxanthine phosphoribosyltransferase
MALTSIKVEHYLSGSNKQAAAVIRYPLCVDIKDQRVLIVDDVNDSGDTLQLASEHLQGFQPREVRTAVIHDKRVTQYQVDYFAKRIMKWRWLIYPWAIHEDINAFISRLSPAPKNLAETQRQLAEQFKIKLPLKTLSEITAFADL